MNTPKNDEMNELVIRFFRVFTPVRIVGISITMFITLIGSAWYGISYLHDMKLEYIKLNQNLQNNVNEKMLTLERNINDKFDKFDSKIEKVNDSIGTMSNQVTKIETTLSNLDISKLNEKCSILSQRVDELSDTLDDVKKK